MGIKEEVLESNTFITSYEFTDINRVMVEKWGELWTNYRKAWADTANYNNVSEVPLYVLLELNSFCNYKCKMCKHGEDANIERKSMPVAMVRKIVEECKEMKVPSINIGTGTECTLHPQFKEIALMIKESGAIDKFFLTNGSTLTDANIQLIFDGEYERVEVSLDAASVTTYDKIRRNGNLSHVESGIEKLLIERQQRRVRLPYIRLSFCVQEDNENEIEQFYRKWENKVDCIEYQKMVKNEVVLEGEPRIQRCNQPFNRLTIDFEGNIYACCSIIFQKYNCIGNIKDMTLQEAWNGEKAKSVRNGFIKGKPVGYCKRCLCNMYGPT